MSKSKDKGVVWFNNYMMPTYWGFCTTEKAWKRQMKKVGCPDEPYPNFEGFVKARVMEFSTPENKSVILVTIGDLSSFDPIGVIALIAHEIEHVWQFMMRHMGETNPSDEFAAYTKQGMLAQILHAYEEHRNKLTA